MKKLWVQVNDENGPQLTLGSLRRMVEMLDADGAAEDTLIYTTRTWRKGSRPVTDLSAYSYRTASGEFDE